MISLKRYLDSVAAGPDADSGRDGRDLAPLTLEAYASAIVAMGNCTASVCPGVGSDLDQKFGQLSRELSAGVTCEKLSATDREVRELLQSWSERAERHLQLKSEEVKNLLLIMVQTAESVSVRDQQSARQFRQVTEHLMAIASLDDLSQIRTSIETSASELKSSIDRMTQEGAAAMNQLQQQVATYKVKLETAEANAARDALTGLRNRPCVESIIQRYIDAETVFCVAIIDIDGFKKVNDEHGHLVGDELLKRFAKELVSACRSTDITGRWGGDEFIIALECGMPEAASRIERLRNWVCGRYEVKATAGALNLAVDASIGLALHLPHEPLKSLLSRADTAMYANKSAGRSSRKKS